MQTDGLSLDLMQLEQPEPVSMLPDTLAWKVLLALLLAAVVLYLWRRYQAYRKALWKREAFALARDAKELGQADTWFTLIKRVHLVHQSTADLVKLDNSQVLDLLPGLEDGVRDTMISGHYQRKGQLSAEDNEALFEAFSSWLDELPVEAGVREKADV